MQNKTEHPVLCLVTQSCLTLCDHMNCNSPVSSVHGDSPGENTGVDCHALLHGNLLNQGIKPRSPHCWQILYHLSHQGSPRIPAWVTYPFSRGASQPRNQTGVSFIAGRFFTNWDTREAPPPQPVKKQQQQQKNSYTKIHPFPFKKK